MKPIRNVYVQNQFKSGELAGLDGELVVGLPYGPDTMKRAMAVTSIADKVKATWCVFDDVNASTTYDGRLRSVNKRVLQQLSVSVKSDIWVIPQVPLRDPSQVQELVLQAAETGYEGLIIRDLLSKYKQGRATMREAAMLKVKAWDRSTATITGYELLERNENEATTDTRGFQVRSSKKGGKTTVDMVGNLLARDDSTGHNWSFSCGSGLDADLRTRLFNERHKLEGRRFTYKYMVHGSTPGVAPRHPVFLHEGEEVH
jgi:ATP-dependent DNA ligase